MPQTYTFASWNVNGLRAVLKKDPSFIQIAQELDVDTLALQETKLQEGQVDIDLPGYHQTWSYAERKGYSGTAVFSRQEPLRVLHADALLPYADEGEAAELVAQAATEGRVCALEFLLLFQFHDAAHHLFGQWQVDHPVERRRISQQGRNDTFHIAYILRHVACNKIEHVIRNHHTVMADLILQDFLAQIQIRAIQLCRQPPVTQ